MARGKPDPQRMLRIQQEIVADAHDAEEQAMGWFAYLEEKMRPQNKRLKIGTTGCSKVISSEGLPRHTKVLNSYQKTTCNSYFVTGPKSSSTREKPVTDRRSCA
jgi:hypothetical protein